MKSVKNVLIGLLLLTAATTVFGQYAGGTFQTDFGKMMLQQNGSQLSGTYDYAGGRIEGTIMGNTATGWWYQTNGKGRFIFVFNQDFSAFTGKWGHDSSEPSATWNGTRIGAAPMQIQPPASYGTMGQATGVYLSDFGDITLEQNGSSVTGRYTHADGRIEGTLNGNVLTGWWYQSNGKGRFSFVFNSAFTAFAGKWGYDSNEMTGTWNGTRKESSKSSTNQQTVIQVEGTEVFSNWNKAGVANLPPSHTYFYIAKSMTITRIVNYHWNDGRGQYPGYISLRSSDGKTYGPWQAVGTSGTGGAQNVNWIVYPNVLIAMGLYQIVDSDPGSWSHNGMSFGSGFSSVTAK